MKYDEPQPNEWITPVRRGYKLARCDCGLVHDVDFRVVARRVQFRVRRNNRSTANMRVGMGLRVQPDGSYRRVKHRHRSDR